MNDAVLTLLRFTGGLSLTKLLARRNPRILMYHRFQVSPGGLWPDAEGFDLQIRYLRSRFRLTPLHELADSVSRGTARDNAVVITIDDGYEDFYKIAYPILQKHGVPATLYVATDFIDGDVWLWPDIVAYILDQTPNDRWTFRGTESSVTFDLRRQSERRAAWSCIGKVCMRLESSGRLARIQALAAELDVQVPPHPTPEFKPLDWSQIREMAANGIEIGSHTCSHARLTLCSQAELFREVVGSKRRIEAMLGQPVRSFCYPYGTAEDIDEAVRQSVVDAGYRNAVVAYTDSRPPDDVFSLRRFSVGVDLEQFRWAVSGGPVLSARVRQLLAARRR